jgi:microcin C transport system substrate-binding protein
MKTACLLIWPVILPLLMSGCHQKEKYAGGGFDFDGFVPKYNQYISNWLNEQETRIAKEQSELEEKLGAATDDATKERLRGDVAEMQREMDRIKFRQSVGDYFSFKTPADVPADLEWKNGLEQPEIGDPAAKKGGTFNYYIPNFPAALRQFGPDANNSFRSEIYEKVMLGIVDLHPTTKEIMPGIAKEWAVTPDNKTVYFKLYPEAEYNDGTPISAKDFMVAVYVRVSDNVVAAYQKQYFREQFAQWTVFDDHTLAVTLADAKPLAPYFAAMTPASPKYFADYGPDFKDRYRWKVEPHAGPYFVKDEDIKKGASITLTRKQDWWAKDHKFYRYRFNADKVHFRVVRDDAKAFELFRVGELDYFRLLNQPQYWYEKSEVREFFNGYIEKHTFFHQAPLTPWGLYPNVSKGVVQNRDVREGLAYATNMKKVIDVIFRGDYERLDNITGGYGQFTNPEVKARPFKVEKAREFFAKAGFTEEGEDGILKKPGGTRLAVSLSYANVAHYPRMMPILKEEAAKAGMEIRLDGLEPTVFYQKTMKKEHEIVFWGWSATPPFPRMYQLFHSKNARDDKGSPKQQTNNLNIYSSPEMDKYVLGIRHATTVEELRDNAWKAQQLCHDEVLFIPAYSPVGRIGCWRWVKWPETSDIQFAPPLFDRPRESYSWWIDEDIRRETLEAKRTDRKFPEAQALHDRYRGNTSAGKGERP